MEEKRFAVLIDSENISARYISSILDEMTKYGVVTYKRIYGDWTSAQTTRWKKELLENSIMPIQQFSNTVGKNATDSALIIDAMDILYTGNVDGFCIVSSDSDFTRLASRLRGCRLSAWGRRNPPVLPGGLLGVYHFGGIGGPGRRARRARHGASRPPR